VPCQTLTAIEPAQQNALLWAVPGQHKLDRLKRLTMRGLWAHLNRKRSGDEIESRAAIGGSGKGGAGNPPGDPARGHPLLVVKRIYFSKSGRASELCITSFPGDIYESLAELVKVNS
jgi:hypothetical protein